MFAFTTRVIFLLFRPSKVQHLFAGRRRTRIRRPFSFLGPLLSIPPRDRALTLSRSALVGKERSDREGEFISCSCESYISTIPLCAVWQRQNDGCHLSYGLKEAVGKGI